MTEEVGFSFLKGQESFFLCCIYAGPEVHLSSSLVGVAAFPPTVKLPGLNLASV